MDDLEQLVRDGLRARADGVDTTAPLVARAQRAARRRRGTRAVLAAAAAVAVVVGVSTVLDRPQEVTPAPAPAPTTALDPVEPPTPMAPDGWRTERWHDLAVDVPADWGYGPAPLRTAGAPYVCGYFPEAPYVGRPVRLVDECIGGGQLRASSAPYVWLGADVEPGTVQLDDGTVQETVEVAGAMLTVAADEPLRRRILASARVGGACPSELLRAPSAKLPVGDTGDGLLVCGYRQDQHRFRLVGGQLLGADRALAQAGAYDAAPPVGSCNEPLDLEQVLLQAGDRQWVFDLSCPAITELGEPGDRRSLTVATLEPWTIGFVPQTLYGPRTSGMTGMVGFIGWWGRPTGRPAV
ncbi:hypothetical protein [Nocardioides sp. W7]|uniref:hypothetical protein n=1 Tax=Nocardioides sp. W7 TaxID=2931390 RepID=UPI001FD38E6D|nr:hypothetical protein [Nocardioides sp. W7]